MIIGSKPHRALQLMRYNHPEFHIYALLDLSDADHWQQTRKLNRTKHPYADQEKLSQWPAPWNSQETNAVCHRLNERQQQLSAEAKFRPYILFPFPAFAAYCCSLSASQSFTSTFIFSSISSGFLPITVSKEALTHL